MAQRQQTAELRRLEQQNSALRDQLALVERRLREQPRAAVVELPKYRVRDDRHVRTARNPAVTSRAEREYAKQLKLLSRQVGSMIESYESGLHGLPTLTQLLRAYAEGLVPWATRVANRMLGEVNARDRDAWRSLGNAISSQLHEDIRNAPVGVRMQELLGLQVSLIKSIPLDAAQRVHELAIQARIEGTRFRGIAAQIPGMVARVNEISESRAILIARTETARAASVLVQARAESVGSTSYIWRTSLDGAVRAGHKAMEGKVCEWANPPAVDEGSEHKSRIMHHHPGEIWNCRCYPEPIISDPYKPTRRGRT
jgi:hypothetical protein